MTDNDDDDSHNYNITLLEDEDDCTSLELEQYFQHKYKIHDETSVAYEENYVLSLAKDDSLTCLAAGLSDGGVTLFDISSERGLYITASRTNNLQNPCICGVRFLDESPNLLLVGTTNSLIRLIDLRTQNEVQRFEYKRGKHERNILCFDRNSNSRVLCLGAEERKSDVSLSFYDVRHSKEMFCYEECHQNDVTSLKFHPHNPDLLCSGSTDGLINIFDLKQPNEDDALLATINTESSVYRVNWHKNEHGLDIISCVTPTNDFKLFEFEGDLITQFERSHLMKAVKRKSVTNCNLINCHTISDGSMILLTGSNLNNGDILRSVRLHNKKLLPFANFVGNKQIVRESILDEKSNVLITGGETGIVTLWTPQIWDIKTSDSGNSDSNKLKSSRTTKSNKFQPY